VAFAVFWVFYLAFFGPKRRAILENAGMSRPAKYDWTLFDLSDQPVSFTRFQGRPVFLNIWATWCGPCAREMPSIARLAQDPRLQGKGIEFVCVATDDSSAVVRRFLEGRSWPMTFLRADRLPAVFLTEGIPATFIIDPKGRVVAAEVGSADWDAPNVVNLLETIAE
jgi:thiol-disulfide isomerase/thioredoxin